MEETKKKPWKVLAAIAGLVLLLAVAAVAYKQLSAGYKDGKEGTQTGAGNTETETIPAPDVTFYDTEGNPVQLSDLFGKPMVLNFWGTWCGYCKKELPGFASAAKTYEEQVQFVFINYEQGQTGDAVQAGVERYLEEGQFGITTYYDWDSDAVSTYGVYSFPMTLLIDERGNIAAGQAGYVEEDVLVNAIEQFLLP